MDIDFALLEQTVACAVQVGIEQAFNSRQARRERFMCAIIAGPLAQLGDLSTLAKVADEFLDASDALDAVEERP